MKKWTEKTNRGFLCLFLTALTIFLSGCGRTEAVQSNPAETETLLEPVGAAAEYEEAAYRDLYQAKVYSAAVFPRVEEYTFQEAVTFSGFAAYPGEKVKKGGALAYADTSLLETQIETMEENLRAMEEDFAEYREVTQEAIEKPADELQNLKYIVEAYRKAEPKPEDFDYEQWKKEYSGFEGRYRILAHSTDTLRLELEQKTELYELDYAWNVELLESMKEQLSQNVVHAARQGEIVAIAPLAERNSVPEGMPVVAVGDRGEKLLICEYINQAVVNQAQDIYALIDGVRYEIAYRPVETETFHELSAQGETVYTSFALKDAGEEVQVGDFAVIVVMAKRCEQALSVPKAAIHKDESGYYVYVIKDGESVYTPVKTGMSDGVYTQILSGLEQKDKVQIGEARRYGQLTAEVERSSFHSEFEGGGYMLYPSSVTVENPIEYGTVYYVETKAALYQHVEKGEVLAEIRVQPDEIALQRQKQKLLRLEERLRDMEKDAAQAAADTAVERAIEQKKEEIEEIRALIADMEEDGAVTQIKADCSGIIINVTGHEAEDILSPKEVLFEIADENTCYVVVENTNQLLHYGNQVTIAYQDLEGNAKTAEGTVANLSEAGVSKSLRSEYSLILLSPEVIGEMAVTTQGQEGWWSRNLFAVSACIREMDNVLVVPAKAVYEMNGNTYVYVVGEDGAVTAHSFVAGGYDSTGYWVIEGLTEGMKVCLK